MLTKSTGCINLPKPQHPMRLNMQSRPCMGVSERGKLTGYALDRAEGMVGQICSFPETASAKGYATCVMVEDIY